MSCSHTASLATDMSMKAKRIYQSGGGSEQEARSRGLLEFFSMEDLRRLYPDFARMVEGK